MHLVARVILLNIVNVLSLSASTLVQQTHYNEKDYKCFASLIVYKCTSGVYVLQQGRLTGFNQTMNFIVATDVTR